MPYHLTYDKKYAKIVDEQDNVLCLSNKNNSKRLEKILEKIQDLKRVPGYWDNPREYIEKLLKDKTRYDDGIFLKHVYDNSIIRTYNEDDHSIIVRDYTEWYNYCSRVLEILDIKKVYITGEDRKKHVIDEYCENNYRYYNNIVALIGKEVNVYQQGEYVHIHLCKNDVTYTFEEENYCEIIHYTGELNKVILMDIYVNETLIDFRNISRQVGLVTLVTDSGLIHIRHYQEFSSYYLNMDRIIPVLWKGIKNG